MKITIVSNAVVATSENEADAIALVKLAYAQVPTGTAVKTSNAISVEKAKAIASKKARAYYLRKKAEKLAANQNEGTPVAINKIEEPVATPAQA